MAAGTTTCPGLPQGRRKNLSETQFFAIRVSPRTDVLCAHLVCDPNGGLGSV